MAESYKARVGKVWQNKKTKETCGKLLKITTPDKFENYTQVDEQADKKAAKKGSATTQIQEKETK